MTNQYTDGGICKTCQAGEVPNADRLGCDECKGQITVNGSCEDCPSGQSPNSDQTICE